MLPVISRPLFCELVGKGFAKEMVIVIVLPPVLSTFSLLIDLLLSRLELITRSAKAQHHLPRS